MSNDGVINTAQYNNVAIITIHNPDKLNAINMQMRKDFVSALNDAQNESAIRSVIITGAGKAFCSGADVSELGQADHTVEKNKEEILALTGELVLAFKNIHKPVIAAVNGITAGIGLSIALACDLRIAVESARFAAIWVKRGLVADGGATLLLQDLVRRDIAFEMVTTGRVLSASEAQSIGLISKLVKEEQNLIDSCIHFAEQYDVLSPIALELNKRLLSKGLWDRLDNQLYLESYAQNICRNTDDHRKAVSSFMKK